MGLGQRVCESRFHLLTPDNTQNISGSRKNLRVGDLVYLRPGFGILGENGVGGGGGGEAEARFGINIMNGKRDSYDFTRRDWISRRVFKMNFP